MPSALTTARSFVWVSFQDGLTTILEVQKLQLLLTYSFRAPMIWSKVTLLLAE